MNDTWTPILKIRVPYNLNAAFVIGDEIYAVGADSNNRSEFHSIDNVIIVGCLQRIDFIKVKFCSALLYKKHPTTVLPNIHKAKVSQTNIFIWCMKFEI